MLNPATSNKILNIIITTNTMSVLKINHKYGTQWLVRELSIFLWLGWIFCQLECFYISSATITVMKNNLPEMKGM